MKYSKRQLKKELKQLFPAPSPQGKEEFLNKLLAPRGCLPEAILVQIGYIHKSVWALSVLLAAVALFLGNQFQEWGAFARLRCLSAAMPLLAVLAVSETFRSSIYGMAELEMASKHNLPQVMLVRMGVLAGVDALIVVLGLAFLVQDGGIGAARGAVYLLVPWLCACVLGIQVERYARGREGVWYCGICGCFLCGAGLAGGEYQKFVYSSGKFYLWVFALLASVVLLARQVWQISHRVEEWKWNLY